MKYYQQLDITDCGPACLAMVASFFGKNLSISQIRTDAGTDVVGTNIKGLLIAAKEHGFSTKALKGSKESFSHHLPTPFIVHMHIEYENKWRDHFVVVKKIKKHYIEIWDPDPSIKKVKVSPDIFFTQWTGYAIFLEPSTDFSLSKSNNLFIKFLPLLTPHKKILLYSFLCSIIIMIFGLFSSFYFKYIFDELIYTKAKFSLNTLSIGILITSLVQNILIAIRTSFLSHFSFKTDLQMNFSYYSHILKLPISFFESRKSGEIISRLADLDKIKQTLFYLALSGIMDLLMITISTPILLKMNSKLFGISFLFITLLSLISICFSFIYKHFYPKIMNQNAEIQSYLFETLNGATIIKNFNSTEFILNEYEKRTMQSITTNWKLNKYGITHGLISNIISTLNTIIIFWIGSASIINGTISCGMLIAFNSLLSYFTNPILNVVNLQNQMQEAFIAAQRVGEILELEPENKLTEQTLTIDKIIGNIKFTNVNFAYGSRKPIYQNLNLTINAGQWVGIVGPSGSGKSTLAKLLLKNYSIQSGEILIDENNINQIDTVSLRSLIGYVPQDIFLFSGSIYDNITLHNKNYNISDVIEAAKKAGADSFIQKLPKKYETILGEHGIGLSGGEKQRIALTRALLGKPSLIILDEATSNLDNSSEQDIHNVIKSLNKSNITVILIAHRLSTVINCDNILVLQNGSLVQQGTHKKLIRCSGVYKQLWNSSQTKNKG